MLLAKIGLIIKIYIFYLIKRLHVHCTVAFNLVNMKSFGLWPLRTFKGYGLDYVKFQEKKTKGNLTSRNAYFVK